MFIFSLWIINFFQFLFLFIFFLFIFSIQQLLILWLYLLDNVCLVFPLVFYILIIFNFYLFWFSCFYNSKHLICVLVFYDEEFLTLAIYPCFYEEVDQKDRRFPFLHSLTISRISVLLSHHTMDLMVISVSDFLTDFSFSSLSFHGIIHICIFNFQASFHYISA